MQEVKSKTYSGDITTVTAPIEIKHLLDELKNMTGVHKKNFVMRAFELLVKDFENNRTFYETKEFIHSNKNN